jgi:ADP-heptose:LPS heptosyltransferase
VKPILVVGMQGLGDCINQRPVVKAASERVETFLVTSWPQLYADCPDVKCVRSKSKLRTQAGNENRVDPALWHEQPEEIAGVVRLGYNTTAGNLHEQFEMLLPLRNGQTWRYDLPQFLRPACAPSRPYIVTRPVTVRSEWQNEARNCRPEYLAEAVRRAREIGYTIVSVASLKDGEEWLEGEAPEADVEFLRGELSVEEILGLVRGAAATIGAAGFLPHAAQAYRVPNLTIWGGRGAFHSPESDFPVRDIGCTTLSIVPTRHCKCYDAQHDCDKTVDGFDGKLAVALAALLPSP